ncbi:helix-turn-helix transcriptional regulator [Bacteroidota bacterium]
MSKETRLFTLIELIHRRPYITIEEILDFFSDKDIDISERTIRRYFQYCRDYFNIDIAYDRYKKGFFINEETSLDVSNVIEFIKRTSISKLLDTHLLPVSKDPYIFPDTTGHYFKGTEQLSLLIEAIRNHQIIEFQYEKFRVEGNLIEHKILKPHFIKEASFKWYLVGLYPNDELPRAFGVDRISDIEITDKTFTPVKDLHDKMHFDYGIGVEVPQDIKSTEIHFNTSRLAGDYFTSFPIHHSQTLINEDKNTYHFSVHLIPNFEFYQRLLMWVEWIEIVKPEGIKQHYLDLLNEGLKLNTK